MVKNLPSNAGDPECCDKNPAQPKKKKSDKLFESIYVTMFLKKQNDATENRTGVA